MLTVLNSRLRATLAHVLCFGQCEEAMGSEQRTKLFLKAQFCTVCKLRFGLIRSFSFVAWEGDWVSQLPSKPPPKSVSLCRVGSAERASPGPRRGE